MNDTAPEIKMLQHKLHMQLSENEKWARGFEMIENGKATLIAALKRKFPDDSDTDIFIKMVRQLYKNDLPADFLDAFEKKARDREQNQR